MSIGSRLIEVRAAHGYSRTRLAEELGRPYSTVTKYEKDERDPGHSYLVEVARKFGVTTDYLLGLEDQPAGRRQQACSAQAEDVAARYDRLDPAGQGAVDAILHYEEARMQAAGTETQPPAPGKVIPLFGCRFAAGPAEPDFDSAWEHYEVPAGSQAEFAIHIHGDSMEPYLPDGSVALGRHGWPRDGEVGAFLLDGEYLCKQACRDSEGNVYLFSLNRARRSADVTVWASAGRNLQCFGTILMKQRVPLPDEF